MREYKLHTITDEEICALHARELLRINYREMSRQLQLHTQTLKRFFSGAGVSPVVETMIREHFGIQLDEPEQRTVLRMWWTGCIRLDYQKISRLTQIARWTVKKFFESDDACRVLTMRVLVKKLGLTERKLA